MGNYSSAEEYQKAYDKWAKQYRPVKFVEYSPENLKMMENQDPRYVWTDHDTCEESQLTSGFHFFGDPAFCCWVTHGWHITEVACEDGDRVIDVSAYIPCECYDEEEDIWNENCSKCEGEGFIQHYFD